mmetsp:Transcript_25306/g.70770  ORF Transcript_25306/g.70770 Transcript_25306/m.70770 type:complete len:398 (-) Transcript_25306:37-1230(-)
MAAETDRLGVEDERKREALRQAGQEYFDRVLAEASTGKDPFAPEQIVEKSAARVQKERRPTARKQRPQREDPDLEAVGAIISGAKLYILTALIIGCTGVGFVFMKASLTPLETPGILTFLHLLPATGLLFACSGALELDPITFEGMKASLPTAIPSMLQVLMVFSSLLHGSVLFVLSFTLSMGQLLRIACEKIVLESPASGRRQLLCGIGLMGTGAVLLGELTVLGRSAPPLRFWLALLAWSAAKGMQVCWELLKRSPQRAEALFGQSSASQLDALREAEEELMPSNLALYQNMVPALPALVLGFCGMEGNELIEHELSVPAVTAIIFSVCCFCGAAASTVLLEPQLTPRLRTTLLGLAAFVSIGFDLTGMLTKFSILSLIGALLACSCTTIGEWIA